MQNPKKSFIRKQSQQGAGRFIETEKELLKKLTNKTKKKGLLVKTLLEK